VQRTGHPDLAVPAGRYTFKTNFLVPTNRTTTSFVLTRPGGVTVTLADSGRHYLLAVGELLTVRLLALPLVWTTAVSSDPQVLISLPEMNSVAVSSSFAPWRPVPLVSPPSATQTATPSA